MNKFLIPVSAILASLALTACSTLNTVPPANQVSNGEYHLAIWPGNVPHVASDEQGNEPGTFGVTEFDQMVYLDRNCRTQMSSQVPSTLKSVGTTTLRTAAPIAVLGGVGTKLGIRAVTSATKGYGVYGAASAGGSGLGAGLGGGIDRKNTGDRYSQAGCVNALVTQAKKKLGILKDVDVVFNADAVNGRSIRRPAGEAPTEPMKAQPDPNAEAVNTPPRP